MAWPPHDGYRDHQLRAMDAELRQINAHLWELNQPPEVRAQLQAKRAERARAMRAGRRLVYAAVGLWMVLSLVFGRAGSSLFGRLFSLALTALDVALVLGGVVAVGMGVWRAVRWVRQVAHPRPIRTERDA